jgi:excinuclease ABC subunit C
MSSNKQEYEKAKEYRNLLTRFSYLYKDFRGASEYINNPYLIEDINRKALEEIKSFLNLNTVPKRIECYDVSNISGKEAVSSMVVASDGKIDKKQYRRFRIKFKNTPDDFGMIYETLSRRFRNFKGKKDGRWPKPDLVVLDGGAPQVSACESVMKDLSLQIPFAGLTKKKETLVIKKKGGFESISVSKDNEGLRLIIRLRDEAHRFAKKYHSLLRRKSLGV